jgi:3-deoxy-D-manno-octulosonate 8-phosphate phosphatase KdsC-like HAD superfamily phosphatase
MQEKLKSIKALILDGDGVWFTGQEFRAVLPSGEAIVMKPRHHHDGQGVSFLRALGLKILFATAEGQPMGSVVEKLNKLPSVTSGAWAPVSVLMDLKEQGTKVDAIEAWLTEQGLTWSDCAYIGDDRTDLESMRLAGVTAVPANGQRLIKKIAHIQLTKDGGQGAIREFAEMVLDARGVDEATLPAA